jgi:hypothetical protein
MATYARACQTDCGRQTQTQKKKQRDSDSNSQSQSHRDDGGLAAVGEHGSYEGIGLVWCLCFMRLLRLGGHGHCRPSVRCCGRVGASC